MKSVHAVWEQRNMGVDCWEITLDENDDGREFEANRKQFETQYTVVKIPVKRIDLSMMLQKAGYYYIETMISCHHGAFLPDLSRIQERMITQMSYDVMTKEDLSHAYKEIRSDMFLTDRVSLDPFFSRSQANERYIGWINDELERGADIYNIKYKNENIGFFAYKTVEEGVYFPFLGGMYPDKEIVGAGFAMEYFHLCELMKRKGKRILESISTNNKAAFSIPVQMGFVVDKLEAVYIKHA
jgi:hypothetical protein